MADTQLLLYIHRGKLQTESVGMWDATKRANALQGCCATIVYRILPGDSSVHEWRNSTYWTTNYSVPVPEEIKLAAMLV